MPQFVELAARDQQAAVNAWGGFAAFLTAAGGVGYLFLDLSRFAAGWAIASHQALAVLLAWVGLLAGAATIINVLAADTPLHALAAATYLPGLLLTIVFRVWAEYERWKGETQ